MNALGFFLGFFTLLFQCSFPLNLPISAFTPFLALAICNNPFERALLWALLAGMCMDLFSDQIFGIYAISTTLITLLLYRLKRLFLSEKPLHLPLFSAIVSLHLTLIQFPILFLFDRRVPLSGKWIVVDLVALSLIDALYAFVWFVGPLTLFTLCKRIWKRFWLRRKRFRTSH